MSSLSAQEVNYINTGYWGLLISSIFLGCSLVQGYHYFQNYNDRWYLKAMVWTMLALDIMSWAFFAKMMHFYLVQNFDRPSQISILFWGNSAGTSVVYVVQPIAQLFFAHQIRAVSNKKTWILSVLIVCLAVTGFGCGLALTVLLATHNSLTYSYSKPVKIVAVLSISIPTACDIIATIAMWYFLDSVGRGFRKTDGTIKSLKFLVLNRGLLLVSTQGILLIIWIVDMESWYWLPFHMNTVNIYVNTTLVMLNERTNIREKERENGIMSLKLATRNQFSLRFTPMDALSRPATAQDSEADKSELHKQGDSELYCAPESEVSGFDLTTNRRGYSRGGLDLPSPHGNEEIVATPIDF